MNQYVKYVSHLALLTMLSAVASIHYLACHPYKLGNVPKIASLFFFLWVISVKIIHEFI